MSEVETKQFVMPRPKRGSAVIWYPHGLPSDTSEIGFVVKVYATSIVLQLASGYTKEGVRFIEDPRLKDNVHQRENGAWDFSEETRKLVTFEKRLEDLEARLAKHEACHAEEGQSVKRKGSAPSTI
jgi:hypothetical protein